MFALPNRWNRSSPDADAAAAEFEAPRSELVASHHDELEDAGHVRITTLLGEEHPEQQVVIVSVGQRSPEPLVRIQSSCLYGETLGSTGCDCRGQLRESLRRMRTASSGILIRLDQEGRGAGLTCKAVAFELAERLRIDRHTAYDRLGFAHDLRSYREAVRALRLLDVDRCQLLTNNPAKVQALSAASIVVRREALWVDHRTRAVKRQHGYLA